MTNEHLIWEDIRRAATQDGGSVFVHYKGRLVSGAPADQVLRDYDAVVARADGLAAQLQAVLDLCDAVDEATLRPDLVDFEPTEVPWTVAVRLATAGQVDPTRKDGE